MAKRVPPRSDITDSFELGEHLDKWSDIAHEILTEYADTPDAKFQPAPWDREFDKLTEALVLWCDQCGVNPEPLVEFRLRAFDLSISRMKIQRHPDGKRVPLLHDRLPPSRKELEELWFKARDFQFRILRLANSKDQRPKLNEQEKRILSHIRRVPHQSGDQIADKFDIEPGTFRKIISKKLQYYGVTNEDGYIVRE